MYFLYGGVGEVVNTLVCGTSMQGFDPLTPPHIEFYAHPCAKVKVKVRNT